MIANGYSRISVVLLVLSLVLFATPTIHAQDSSSFARQGCVELGGSISFLSTTPVFNGTTGTATTVITVQPFIGFFAADGFEVGLDPLGITSMSAGGTSITEY